MVTTASPASVNLDGSTTPTLSDSAVLSGGYFETGSITFTLSGPGGFSYSQTDPVSGDGTYNASTSLPTTGTVAGTYTWSASYSGDDNNKSTDDQGGSAEQTVALANAQIVATPMSFASDGGVDYGYQITGGDLPQATTVDLYWASGTTTDTEIGGIVTTTTETAQGTYPLNVTASALGTPPAGAKYLLEVVDPDNVISPADPSKVASLALGNGNIVPTDLAWDPKDGGVDFGYQITGGDLPQATTVDLYWATGKTFDTVPPGTTSFSGTKTETAQGNYGPIVSARQFIPDPPPWAKYILAVADPENLVRQEDGKTNVEALAIPSISISDMEWNTDLNGTEANFTHRGIDFDYTIGDSNLPIPTTLAFYWASGPVPADIIKPAVDQVTGQPAVWQVQTAAGLDTGNPLQDGYKHLNDPARWGTPPPGATWVVAVADPDDKIIKQANSPADEIRTFDSLKLATEAQILKGSVEAAPSGPDINATFTPGGLNSGIPISEAEVSLGVDHFNWYQEYTDPQNWSDVTVPYGLESFTYDKGDPPLYDGNFVPTVAAAGDRLYQISDPLGPQPVIRLNAPVDSQPAPKPTVDPIVEPKSGPLISQGEIYHLPDGNSYLGVIGVDVTPDEYLPYYNDSAPSGKVSLGIHLLSTDLTFFDSPDEPQFVDILNPAKPPVNPYGPSGYTSFSAVYLRIAGANNSIVGDAKVFLTRLWIRRRLAMGPYSMDLRERVAAVIDEGEGSQRQVAKRFRVSVWFVTRLLQRRRDAGTLAPKPHGGGPRPVLGFPNRYDWRC